VWIRKPRVRGILSCAIGGACAAGALVLVPHIASSQFAMLSGTREKDFGLVTLGPQHVLLNHDFLLRNEGRSTIEIVDVKESCGCLDAQVMPSRVPPGGDVRVTTGIRLHSPGVRRETVTLLFAGEVPPVQLSLVATAAPANVFTAHERHVNFAPGKDSVVHLSLLRSHQSERPDEPVFEVPPSVEVSFDGWTLIHSGDPSRAHPERWSGAVRVRAVNSAGNDALLSSDLRASMPGAPELLVTLGVAVQ